MVFKVSDCFIVFPNVYKRLDLICLEKPDEKNESFLPLDLDLDLVGIFDVKLYIDKDFLFLFNSTDLSYFLKKLFSFSFMVFFGSCMN